MDHIDVEKISAATTSFSLDDAFSDDDDIDPNLEFSSIAIRADLARTISYSQEDEGFRDAEEPPDIDAAGDTEKPLPGPSSLVCGIPVTLREPHCSVGIFRALP
jgi:hypothetical protein